MRTYNTVNDIKTEIEALYRNITGRPQLTAVECDIVYGSIIDAYQLVILEYGVETFKFQEQEIDVDTVADQNYIDLDIYSYKVVNGTVRIPSERQILGLLSEQTVLASDPNLEATGCPSAYAYLNSGATDVIRLMLWPIPDAVYTVYMKVLQYPSDSITNFPTYLMSAIKNKAKSLACLGLGMPNIRPAFEQAYEEVIAKIKDGYNNDSPRHVRRIRGRR